MGIYFDIFFYHRAMYMLTLQICTQILLIFYLSPFPSFSVSFFIHLRFLLSPFYSSSFSISFFLRILLSPYPSFSESFFLRISFSVSFFLSILLSLYPSFTVSFLDASSHLYNSLCRLVGWLVGWSVGNAFIKNIKFMHFFNRKGVLTQ